MEAKKRRWVPLGEGINGDVYSMFFDKKDNLYVGGKFNKAGEVKAYNIAKWDGNQWEYLGLDSLNNGVDGSVWCISIDGDEIYVGGRFSKNGKTIISNIAKWNISTKQWLPLGKGLNDTVFDILIKKKSLYAVGIFTSSGEQILNRIARWDGKQWSSLGCGVEGEYPQVKSIVSLGNDLYIGGSFSIVGGQASFNIAKWSIPIIDHSTKKETH